LDERSKASEEDLKNRTISEKEFAKTQKDILNQKAKAEADADKKIRDIKRKQFIADKVAALAEIVISTAKNVAENPTLTAFYIGIGAAQGAIVAAQPVPYKKGTKSAKGGLSRVDEEGAEMIIPPGPGRITTLQKGTKVIPAKQTKRYEKVFDAMVDDRFEDYVLKTYITPELQKQKVKFVQSQEKRMADAITKSMVVNNTTNNTTNSSLAPSGTKSEFWLERIAKGGVTVKNIDQISESSYQRSRISHKR
jgi:hypothetical protein